MKNHDDYTPTRAENIRNALVWALILILATTCEAWPTIF